MTLDIKGRIFLLNHYTVHLKLIEHRMLTILGFKLKLNNNKKEQMLSCGSEASRGLKCKEKQRERLDSETPR